MWKVVFCPEWRKTTGAEWRARRARLPGGVGAHHPAVPRAIVVDIDIGVDAHIDMHVDMGCDVKLACLRNT